MAARSSARFLAPLALIVCFLAVLGILASAGGRDDPEPPRKESTRTTPKTTTTAPTTTATDEPTRYTVKTGDVLSTIAEKTGVSVARIQELNPELDPQSLVAGQQIKLRP